MAPATKRLLTDLKAATEEKWRNASIDPHLYGFQIQRSTRWNPGLSEQEITEYERALGVQFPDEFKAFLRVMNGTDRPTINIYGSCGEAPREGAGIYAYPRDLKIVKEMMGRCQKEWTQLSATMAAQGFRLTEDAKLVPIYAHRYVVCTGEHNAGMVLSIQSADDAIVYADSLTEYLEKEFLR
jgi:hypothetical protein